MSWFGRMQPTRSALGWTDESFGCVMRSAETTRQVILRAALQLFAEEGFETVGVRDIGLRARVDHSLVNRYYGGKDELFIEVVKACDADWRSL